MKSQADHNDHPVNQGYFRNSPWNKMLYNTWEIKALYFSFPFLNSQIIKYPWLKWRISSSMESHSGFFASKTEEADLIMPSVCSAKNDIIFGHLVLELLSRLSWLFSPLFVISVLNVSFVTVALTKKQNKKNYYISGFRNLRNSKKSV